MVQYILSSSATTQSRHPLPSCPLYTSPQTGSSIFTATARDYISKVTCRGGETCSRTLRGSYHQW
ncbi:hypothetical protein BDZ91DRAFT_452000 [Kalaharituber pfeilii]|nr:hypothetical protein BDZ91DRAFT_452000 [Kalaharituber pfeilii]